MIRKRGKKLSKAGRLRQALKRVKANGPANAGQQLQRLRLAASTGTNSVRNPVVGNRQALGGALTRL